MCTQKLCSLSYSFAEHCNVHISYKKKICRCGAFWQNWECRLFITRVLVFYLWVKLFLFSNCVIISNFLCYNFWRLILFDKSTWFCVELAHCVRMIKQIWTLAVMVKHCGRCYCSVKCLNLCKVCIVSSFILLTQHQILSESRMSWEMRNMVRILALLLLELSDLQAAGTHYRLWIQQ
jgi:hypothetical protein